ncbi:hypothetical protein T492DRAFT_1046975 [Pavlovales sp. CCMP2436]|nr:hypothetical protein T492DRAFT_1046975 [Pavlovales sp. CCMP2436]
MFARQRQGAALRGADQSSELDSGVERVAVRAPRTTSVRPLLWALWVLVVLGMLTLLLVRSGLYAYDKRTSLRAARGAPMAVPTLSHNVSNRSGLPDNITGRFQQRAVAGRTRLPLPPSVAKKLPPRVAKPVRGYDALKPPARLRDGSFCSTFRVGDRRDFLLVLAPIFVELGLCPSESSFFDVYWGIALNALESFGSSQLGHSSLPVGAILNSVPLMMQVVGEKPSIASLQTACKRYLIKGRGKARRLYASGWCNFTQRGFNARRESNLGPVLMEFDALRDYVRKRSIVSGSFPSIWIRKSAIAYSQKGIELVHLGESDVSSDSALIRWVEQHVPFGDYTLQEYLAVPMLWNNRKFDLRVMALMTSVQPLRFYVLDHAFPKIATKSYTLDLASLDDSCVHFRLVACTEPVSPYPRSTDSPLFREGLRPPLKSDKQWDEKLYPAVYKVVLRVVLLARREVIPADEKLVLAGFRHKRVQVLQPDVIFDVDGNAYVIEMNTNGFMVGSLHKEFFDTTPQIRSATEIAGVNNYPLRPRYEAEATRLLRAHCALEKQANWEATSAGGQLIRHHLPVAAPRCLAPTPLLVPHAAWQAHPELTDWTALWDMLDEWCHAGRWMPIWPPREESTYANIQRMYADMARPELRAKYWTASDGVLLRFSRWLQLDAGVGARPPLPFCHAAQQLALENRTIKRAQCKCPATGRAPPSNSELVHVLNRQRRDYRSGHSDEITKLSDKATHALTFKLPRPDRQRFPAGYRGLAYRS